MKLFYTAAETDSRAFLLRALALCGVENPTFGHNANGKPFLQNASLFFNLSHSGVTAVAVSDREIGLDVQRREKRRLSAIQNRLTAAERKEDFFELWTAKEAYVKYCGGTLAAMLPALEYRDGTLLEHGTPAPVSLFRTELCGCALCACTRFAEPAELILL